MKQGNADAENKVDEYYPAWKNPTGISQITGSNPSELVKVTYYSLNGTLLSAPQKESTSARCCLRTENRNG